MITIKVCGNIGETKHNPLALPHTDYSEANFNFSVLNSGLF